MSDLSNRVQALESGLTSASQVRLSLSQLGIVIAAIAGATWWAGSHMASKDDVRIIEEKVTAVSGTLKEVATTVAVLKDRSDRFEIPMMAAETSAIPTTDAMSSAAAPSITRAHRPAPATPAATASASAPRELRR
jgi:hypothetical protein